MSEPVGLNMSLDALIKKRMGGAGGGRGGSFRGEGRRDGGGLGVRDAGVNKFGDRKQFSPRAGEQAGQQRPQQFGQSLRGGLGGRGGGGSGAGFQQRRGGFGGRGGRQQLDGQRAEAPAPPPPRPEPNVQTYLDDTSGNVVVKLEQTEIVKVSPDGHITLKAGGWFTQMTLDTMNKALGVLQIQVKPEGHVGEGKWLIRYGPHLIRFHDGVVLRPKNPVAATQRAPIVLAAMTGAPPAAAAAAAAAPAGAAMASPFGAGAGAFGFPAAAGLLMQSVAPMAAAAGGGLGAGAMGGAAAAGANQLSNAAAAANAALVLARARAAFGLGTSGGIGSGAAAPAPAASAAAPSVASGLTQAQQQYAMAALAQNPALLAGLVEQASGIDPDVLRRLKAQGRA